MSVKAFAVTAAAVLFATNPAAAQTVTTDATVNVCAVMTAKDGREAELQDALLSLVEPTRAEEGNIAYDVHQTEDGGLFLYEVWRSQADLDVHLETPYVTGFVAQLDDLLDGANDAHFGRLLASAEPDLTTRPTAAEGRIDICSFKRAQLGRETELRDALLALVRPTEQEDGLLAYRIYEEADGGVFLYESWRSRADLEQHFQTPYVRAYRATAEGLTMVDKVFIGRELSEQADR